MSETQGENVSPEEEKEVKKEAAKETQDEVKAEEASETETESEEKDSEAVEENFQEKFYYVAAELENLKRRHEKERTDLIKFGNEKVLSSLIEVVDNLDRTLNAIAMDEDPKVKNILVGIEMVQKQFLEKLKECGLERLESLGQEFDPNLHEAMGSEKAEGKKEQEIIKVFEEGYKLNGRLLRAAKVIVVQNS